MKAIVQNRCGSADVLEHKDVPRPVAETAVGAKPASLTFEQAAAVPLAGNTALIGVRDLGEVGPGRKPLVDGASGGVSDGGTLLGPIGLLLRALVVGPFVSRRVRSLTAVSSPENLAVLAELPESGEVTPVIERGYPLTEAAGANRYVEVEHARAKVVITV